MVTQDDVRRALAVGAQAGGSMMLWGPAGSGKTSTVRALAEALDFSLEVVIVSIRDATDLGGLPLRTESGVVLAPPAWAQRIVDQDLAGQRTVLFFDEATTAPPPVQAAMLRVILERVVGEVSLPDSTIVVAAANPPDEAADGFDLAAPLANRFIHLDWPIDAAAWSQGILSGWPTPELPRLGAGWRAQRVAWAGRVHGFISHRPGLLHDVPGDPAALSKAWPSPRTWDMVCDMGAAVDAAAAGEEVLVSLLEGCVGPGATAELLVWIADSDLPDPELLLGDPAELDLPMRTDRLLAALAAVVARVASDPGEQRWKAAWDILDRVVVEGQPDVAAVVARPLIELRQSSWSMPTVVERFRPLLEAAGSIASS